ncbi:MAG: phosphate transport system permease protein, partial [Pseudomonadota bacterium]|nr:phosphate transport system permease protein [Pseudomonadota bacterium]
MKSKFTNWWQSGSPFIWLNAGAVSASIIVVFGLLLLIAMRGMGHFWPADIAQIEYKNEAGVQRIIGERVTTETVSRIRYEESGGSAPEGANEVERVLVKTGNREVLGTDFRWLDAHQIQKTDVPENLAVIERVEWGNFYGYLKQVSEQQQVVASDAAAWPELLKRLERVRDLREEIHDLEKGEIGAINYQLERLRLQRKKLALEGQDTEANLAVIAAEEAVLDKSYQDLRQQLLVLFAEINRDHASFEVMDGQQIDMPLAKM